MSETPTRRQREIYLWIVCFFSRNLRMPTIREIGLAHGINSPNGVVVNLNALRAKGLLAGEVRPKNPGPSGKRQSYQTLRLTGISCFEPVFEESPAGETARMLWEEALSCPAANTSPENH